MNYVMLAKKDTLEVLKKKKKTYRHQVRLGSSYGENVVMQIIEVDFMYSTHSIILCQGKNEAIAGSEHLVLSVLYNLQQMKLCH